MANESMNCGISAKLDSSYMPPKPLLLPRITKTGSGLSDGVSGEKVVVQRLGGDDTLSPLSCVTSGRCHSSSETSNGESACSIQWSSAEDEVIKANLKEPTASKDVDMVMKVGGHQIPFEEHGLCTTRFKESKQSEASAGYSVDRTTTSKGQCSGEQVGSPETMGAAFQVDDWVRTKGNPAKLKLADEDATCSNQEEDTDKLTPIVEPNRREPSSQCQLLEQIERSDHLYEVKVCDTCGDVGREHLLASCSKCSDGAEHIYCMRGKLDKVPEGCWICEDCKLEEEKRTEEKQKQKQDIVSVKSGSFGDDRTLLDSKDLDAGDSRTFEGLPSRYSANRPPSSLVVTPIEGKLGIETSGMTSKLTNSFKHTVLPNTTSFKRRTTNRQGSFRRSKSLGNVKRPEKLKLVCGVVNNFRSRRDNRIKTLRKSASLNSSQPRYARNSNLKIPSFKLSDVEELRRFKHHNDQSLGRSTNTLVEARPLAELPATDGNACGSTFGQELQQESESRILSGPKFKSSSSSVAEIGDSDLRIQGQKQTVAVDLERISCSTEAAELGDTDLLYEGQNKVDGVALERTCNPSEAARATKITNSVEPLPVGDLPHAVWSTLSTSGMPAIPESNCVWEGGFLIQQDGRPFGTLGGVQAHMSTRATQLVLQNVYEFPRTILLEKVVRIDKLSAQFLEEHAKADNSVLFSLPKEQSFERNDGSLSDYLIADDVCLEGDIGGFELLIFSSNLLVDRSQSWKKLFPLWGVLKTRTSNCLMDLLPRGEAVPSHSFSLALANSQNSKSSVLSSWNTPCYGTSVIMDMEPNPLPSPTATALTPVSAMKFCTSKISYGNKSLHLPLPNETDSLSLHQQLLAQGDNTVSKRRQEINLNCSNGGWFAEEPEQKRLRTSIETFTYLGFNHADVLAKESDLSLGNGSGSSSTHEQTSGWSVCSEPGVPNLELSLGSLEKPANPLALEQFLGIFGDSNVGIDHLRTAGDHMEDGAWLSLSLSLPTSGKEQLWI